MNDLSAVRKPTTDDGTEAEHRAAFDVWLQRNREQEALSAAKWRRIAAVLLPLVLLVVTVTWYFKAH